MARGFQKNFLTLTFSQERSLFESCLGKCYPKVMVINDIPSPSPMNKYGDIYRSFQQVLIAQNRFEAALELAEQSRIRSYREFLTAHLLLAPSQHPPLTLPSLTEIKEIIKTTQTTLIYYSIIYDERQLDRFYRYQLSSKEPFYFSPISLLIWVIQETGEIRFKDIDLKPFWQDNQISLAGLVRRVWEECHRQPGDLDLANLALLYQFLIEPIVEWLPSTPNSHLTIIPQDFLYFVPFAALRSPENGDLIERYCLRIIPSLQEFQELHHLKTKTPSTVKKSALVVGNPTMPSLFLKEQPTASLPDLSQKEAEAWAIAKFFHTHALIGSAATKAAVLNGIKNAAIVHLATYAMLSYQEGFPCAIAIAPGIGDHGWLTAQEIMKLQLNVELIVISASYSKSGNLWSNGIEGVMRTLIRAGARRVLLSLYPTTTYPTEDFLLTFYQYFLDSQDQAYALQQAILATKKHDPRPKYWAGWILC